MSKTAHSYKQLCVLIVHAWINWQQRILYYNFEVKNACYATLIKKCVDLLNLSTVSASPQNILFIAFVATAGKK